MASLALVFIMLIFGATFIVVKDVVHLVAPVRFLALRFLVAGAILAFAAAIEASARSRAKARTGSAPDGRADLFSARVWRDGALLGGAFYLGYLTQTVGLAWISPATSAFLTGLSVVIVPVLGLVFLAERVSLRVWLGVLAATLGLAALTLRGGLETGPGVWVTLGTALAFGVQILLTARFAPRSTALALAATQVVVAAALAVVTLPFDAWLYAHGGALAPPTGLLSAMPEKAWFVAIAMGVGATALTFFLQTWAQRRMSATRAAIYFTLEPVFAALFSWAFYHERFGLTASIGMLLILCGMVLVETREPAR